MILSDTTIIQLIREGKLKILPPIPEKNIKCCHLDLHLAPALLKYTGSKGDLKDNSTFATKKIIIPAEGYELQPHEFVVGSTVEEVFIPNGYMAFVETKGNIARAGIQTHNTDGHIDPGFNGTITLEITNNSNRTIVIYPHLPFVQVYFFQLTGECRYPYYGKYQYQSGPTGYEKD